MGELTDGEHVKVDAEGEGPLGEFTFEGVPFTDADGAEGDLAGKAEDAAGEGEAGDSAAEPVASAASTSSVDGESAGRSED